MIRVADYISQTISDHGIRHVFIITGGGAMHLNDAFGRNKALEMVCCHHEQTCSMAAESYYKYSNKLAAVNVTTGPGATNAITGVYGAYVDSLGMIVISGQCKWETIVRSTDLPLRQMGDQEVDIVKMVQGITKYAVVVSDPKTIRYHLERALHLSTQGRPGPVWIDVPINIQGSLIDPSTLSAYDPKEDELSWETPALDPVIDEVLSRLAKAKRPVILAGAGVRLSGMHQQFLELVDKLGIPVVTAFNSHDLVANSNPYYAGRPGSVGDRAGNFAVQNSDLLIILGCRLNIRIVSYNWENFAKHAYKIWVDIDAAELKKPTVKPDLPVHADLTQFIPRLLAKAQKQWSKTEEMRQWVDWCLERRRRYPVVLPEYWNSTKVNPYCLMDRLFKMAADDDCVVTANGTASVAAVQAATLSPGMRLYHNSGSAPMGFDVPAAIGAAIARGGSKRVICLAGDGSIMMNLQELQTITELRLPVKIFILCNEGYHSIRQTQTAYFKDNIFGCNEGEGFSFPDWEKLASAFSMGFARICNHAELDAGIQAVLEGPGAVLCEVQIDITQPFAPKFSARKLPDGRMITPSPEDMSPFLSREELKENLLGPLAADHAS